MTTEFVTEPFEIETNANGTDVILTTEQNQSEFSTESASGSEFAIKESVNYTFNSDGYLTEDTQSAALEVFNIIEIIMTSLELTIVLTAAIKMKKWRKNYRNQMLMQISLVRFLKRIIVYVKFEKDRQNITSSNELNTFVISAQIYADFVTAILVFFFIKHMYDSLILVLVKISQNNFYKVLITSWVFSAPVSGLCTALIVNEILSERNVHLLYCVVFKWPLLFVGTSLYLTVLYKVMSDKKRRFAASLTVVTFLLCLVINFYLFSIDVIKLWCHNNAVTVLVSYVLGFMLNALSLCLYIVLITLSFKSNAQTKSMAVIIDE